MTSFLRVADTAVTRFAISPPSRSFPGDLLKLPPVAKMISAPPVFRRMVREDGVPVLQDMERLYCMPVIKMEIIKFPACIEPAEIFHHPFTHAVTILHNVIALRLAVMVKNTIDSLVRNPATGEIVHLMVLRQGLGKMRRCRGKSAYALGIERFPAENGYLK